ncbi:MAG: hypothetical protein KF894_07155 [Labilithrix sp.]|nr:hypothetical protein [Labilithrix sp.]
MRGRPAMLLLVAAALIAGGAAPPPAMPHPAPNARAANNAACEGCHVEIAAEWRQSLHRSAFTDATFQRAFAIDPDPFCRDCHAAESDPKLGVACVTCHVTNADVLAVPGERRAPHPLTRSPEFATEAACARCHEFDFPDAHLRKAPLAMQRTLSEHRHPGAARETCASCHMTKRGGHADHRFAASRDDAFVKSAVSVRAKRSSATTIEVSLAPARIGHAFPTGDLFRRVRISAAGSNRYLARHFGSRQEIPGVFVRSEIGDDRVLGGERVVVMTVPPDKTRVRVVYERAEGPSDPASSSARVAGAIDLFDAEL